MVHYHLLPLLLQGVKELVAENAALQERLRAWEQGAGGPGVASERMMAVEEQLAAQREEISDLKAQLQALEQRQGAALTLALGSPRGGLLLPALPSLSGRCALWAPPG